MFSILVRDVDYLGLRCYTSRMADASLTPGRMDQALHALEEQLRATRESFELVVIGGSALQALRLIDRATRDVDVLALADGKDLLSADPFPAELTAAANRVARDFGLPESWLNAGPADLVRLGLPTDFMERVETRLVGPSLTVHFASRYDQVHFKLYAMVDHGAGRHEMDLKALRPIREELLAAARWARTHDPSQGFRAELVAVLSYLGVDDADVGP
jgi:hypothetical protein